MSNEISFSTLAHVIDEAVKVRKTVNEEGETVYEEGEKKTYNTSLKKEWNGNMKLFAVNPLQYKKRFHKGDCCENNMIEWKQGNDSIFICKDCGYIDERNSHVEPIIEEKKEMFNGMEKEMFFGEENENARLDRRSTKCQERTEPDENDIKEGEKYLKWYRLSN